jgi:secondary thiamine-phosphate synthase enzyme
MTIDIDVETSRRIEARDVTELVAKQELRDGIHVVSTPHTTAAVLLSEADEDLLRDLERAAGELLRPLEPFAHARQNNPNAAAHIFASLAGTQLLVEVEAGQLVLGRYQRLCFLELDGPRRRRLRLRQLIPQDTR